MSAGGVVPHTGKKLFFFVAYDKFHDRYVANPSLWTIPTPLMNQGNFTELNGGVGSGLTERESNNPAIIYDPTTTSTTNCPAGASICRQPFASDGTYNVIPSGDISPIAKAMAAFMPAPTNPSVLVNNYLAGTPKGYDNHLTDWRVDYDLSPNHRISSVGTIGVVNYLNNYGTGGSGATAYGYLPPPYMGGDLANIYPKNYIVEDAYTITAKSGEPVEVQLHPFLPEHSRPDAGRDARGRPEHLVLPIFPAGRLGKSSQERHLAPPRLLPAFS